MPDTNTPEGEEVLALPIIEAEHRDAEDYLARLRQEDALTRVTIETAVLDGPVAARILDAAELRGADLLVLCSHGRTGVLRWAV